MAIAPLPSLANITPARTLSASDSRTVARSGGSANAAETQVETQAGIVSIDSEARGQREREREFAHRRILELRERIRALKLLHTGDAKALAHAVAQFAKELNAAVKDYREAGGTLSYAGGAGDATTPAAAADAQRNGAGATLTPEEAREVAAYHERVTRAYAAAAEADALGDAAVIQDVRGITHTLRDFLAIHAPRRDPHSKEGHDADSAERDLCQTDRTVDSLQDSVNAAHLSGRLMDTDA